MVRSDATMRLPKSASGSSSRGLALLEGYRILESRAVEGDCAPRIGASHEGVPLPAPKELLPGLFRRGRGCRPVTKPPLGAPPRSFFRGPAGNEAVGRRFAEAGPGDGSPKCLECAF